MQVESRGNLFTMPRRRRFKPRTDCEAILGKLSLLVNPITLNPSFDKGGACCKPTVCHLRCGDALDSVDCVYSGLVVYAARLKWQGLVANPWFATYGVGDAGYCWYYWDSVYACYTEYAATR